jgi:predicted Zn-dependent protease with MMP-like domain/Flp pilus assembly protein TadD
VKLEDGDLEGARQDGLALEKEVPEAPEIPLLLGACAMAEGNVRDTLRCLARAGELDPDWAEPDMRTAEILAAEGQLEEALKFATAAEGKSEEEAELLEAIAIKAGLELELERSKVARKTLSVLPEPALLDGDPDLLCELGHLFLAAEDPRTGRGWFDRAIALEGSNADAWHGLGLAAELTGDEEGKRRAWLETLKLDAQDDGELPELLSEGQVAEVAEAALGELPPKARSLLDHIPILIADRPAQKDVATGLDPRLLGLFAGTAYPEVSALGASPQLTQILLFRRNLERVVEDEEELREEIRTTLLHETGHFFGMSEDDLQGVGLG